MFQHEILRNPDNASPELRDFFYHHPPSFFQGFDFLRLLKGVAGFKPFILTLKQQGEIVATLAGTSIREGNALKRWASERTVVYGHPVIKPGNDHELVMKALLYVLKPITKSSLFTQFRNDTDQEESDPVFREAGFRWFDRLNLIKPIHDIGEAWTALSASRKRQINSSRSNGILVNDSPNINQVREFYLQLKSLYKYKVRKPLPPLAFFERFHQLSTNNELNGKIILCSYEGKVVSGILCPFTSGASIYEWYVCGLDEEYRSKKIYPSVMATWAAMELGNSLGCKSFDFMGLGIPGREYGVRDFKARFGGNWVNHGRWSRVNNPVLYSVAEFGYNALRLLRKV